MHKPVAVVLCALGLPVLQVPQGPSRAPCLMDPPYETIRLPESGLIWLEGTGLEGACREVMKETCVRRPLGSGDLMSCPDGPDGTGRWWRVAIGIAGRNEPTPARGVCVMTSTVAWRVLLNSALAPLPWLDDIDADGKAEAIIWTSFLLRKDGGDVESGLVGWVYQVAPGDMLVIDWESSRQLARKVAGAYRLPPEGSAKTVQTHMKAFGSIRKAARDALESFAERRCATRLEGAR